MQRDTDETLPLKELWTKEIAVRKEAQQWGGLSNAGFIGLVATEIPEFIAKEKAAKPAWRLPLFVVSSASIVSGVVMNWIKGHDAEQLRNTALMIEHGNGKEQQEGQAGKWRSKVTAQQEEALQQQGSGSRNL